MIDLISTMKIITKKCCEWATDLYIVLVGLPESTTSYYNERGYSRYVSGAREQEEGSGRVGPGWGGANETWCGWSLLSFLSVS